MSDVRQRFAGHMQLPGTVLEFDRVVPGVALRERSTGAQVSPTDFRQRRALVLCFLHADCEPCRDFAAGLADLADGIRSADAEVRAVLPEEQPAPLPVWVDADGRARRRLLGSDGQLPVVLILDRYAAAQQSHPAADHDFPDPGAILSTLRHQSMLCPECGT
ncbi:MAG TPA: redoxin domain-containing protein [Egibacteraceae bacterium]|nr:redoxin domain-containing protein [Egibacteraceae bacterium]